MRRSARSADKPCWRALAKGTAWAFFYCAIHHHAGKSVIGDRARLCAFRLEAGRSTRSRDSHAQLVWPSRAFVAACDSSSQAVYQDGMALAAASAAAADESGTAGDDERRRR